MFLEVIGYLKNFTFRGLALSPEIKAVILVFTIFFFTTPLIAQSVVTGIVINKKTGEPIEGVAITSYYLKTGVFTDYKGRYSLSTETEDSLKLSSLGYQSQSIPIHGGWHTAHLINILLATSEISLPNLIVTEHKIYKLDSVQNREDFSSIFEYKSPQVFTSFLHTPLITAAYGKIQFGSGLGFNIESALERYISAHYRRLRHFQKILLKKERADYVTQYFNPEAVSKITGLKGIELKKFLQD